MHWPLLALSKVKSACAPTVRHARKAQAPPSPSVGCVPWPFDHVPLSEHGSHCLDEEQLACDATGGSPERRKSLTEALWVGVRVENRLESEMESEGI